MVSRKKRDIKYYKNHLPPKRPRLSTVELNTNAESGELLTTERPQGREHERETSCFS